MISIEDKAQFMKAVEYFRSDDYANAAAVFSDILSRAPEDKGVLGMLGWSLLSDGNLEESAKIFRDLVARSPHSEKASLGLFHSLWRQGYRVEALDELQRYLVINPSSQEYQMLRKDLVNEVNAKGK